MPPSADPVRLQIVDAMVAGFLAMDTTGYFYVPDCVAPIEPPLKPYLSVRSENEATVYGLWVEDEDNEERSSGRIDDRMRVFIQAATRYEPEETDPFKKADAGVDSEEEVRSKLAHDIKRFVERESFASQGGTQLGGLYENWEVLGNDSFQVNSVRCPGWVMIQIETLVSYHTRLGEPSLQGAA